jgi:hypothetical protein
LPANGETLKETNTWSSTGDEFHTRYLVATIPADSFAKRVESLKSPEYFVTHEAAMRFFASRLAYRAIP